MKHSQRLLIIFFLAAGLRAESDTASGKPKFFARRDYPGLAAQAVGAADTNGDGIPDMITFGSGIVGVQFGNGNGTFEPAIKTSQVIISFTYSFIPVDLNGDNKVDLIIPGGLLDGPGGFAVCLGNGDGTFQPGTFYETNDPDILYAIAGDFNGDGKLDIAAAGSMGVWLLTGHGNGTFNAPVLAVPMSGASSVAIATADFNSDGKLDLVVPTPGSGFVVLFGNGNGTFQPPLAFPHPQLGRAAVAGVLVKGGFPGIVIPATSTTVCLYIGNGQGGFTGPLLVNLPGEYRDTIAIADVNGDGFPDLISGGVYIALGTASGEFHTPVFYPINDEVPPYNIALASLRNNGLIDILTNSQNSISVLLNTGNNGKYEDGLDVNLSGGAGCGVSADFNGDGKPDLAVNSLSPSGISIFLGTGTGNAPLTLKTTIPASGVGCLVTGDVNGDGIPDLVAPADGNTVVTYLGKGDGTFTLKSTTSTPFGGYVALGDFNHDGKLDFATSGNLLALGNGDGTFQTPQPYIPNPLSGGFSNLAVGDINNDGWPDVVLTNDNFPYQNIYVLLNSQHGGFTSAPTNFGDTTDQAILVDLNGDGNLDLVTSGTGGAVYLGDGKGDFTYKETLVNEAYAPGFNIVADLNGDGVPDIGVLGANTLAIFFGQGSAKYAAPFYLGLGLEPTSLTPANLHGQAPGSGIPDMVSTDASTGVVVLINQTP